MDAIDSASAQHFTISDLSANGTATRWQRIIALVTRERVRISAIAFAAWIVKCLIARTAPHDVANFTDGKSIAGILLVLGGVALRSWAAGILTKSQQLSTAGPYGMVRNPLYDGSFLMMLGFCLLIDGTAGMLLILAPLVVVYAIRIYDEENSLALLFQDQWKKYVAQVPRFLPNRLPSNVLSAWSFDQWKRNHEYRAVFASLAGLVGVKLWHIAYLAVYGA